MQRTDTYVWLIVIILYSSLSKVSDLYFSIFKQYKYVNCFNNSMHIIKLHHVEPSAFVVDQLEFQWKIQNLLNDQ